MKKELMILNILLMAIMTGCIQGNNFDLKKMDLPISKESLQFDLQEQEGTINLPFISYVTEDKEAMRFDNLSLSGTLNKDEKPFSIQMANSVAFYEDKNSKMIDGYQIQIETTDKTLALEALLEKKFGKADFHYKNTIASYRIWESGGKAYFFDINYTGEYLGESYTEGNLYVVNKNNETLYRWAMSGGFSYYSDYLREKNSEEHKDEPYTYRDFVKQKEAEHTGGVFPVSPYVENYVW